MLQRLKTPEPGSLRKTSSSGVDLWPRMAKIWNKREGSLAKAQGVFQSWLRLHLPQLSFKPVTRLNTGLAPATWSARSATK